MKEHSDNQYDDDLTVGTEDYDDSYYTDSVDLFEFSTDDESPINRLKSLILSIDWEITDDVLRQFNEELLDLKDIWSGQKINLVYVQALEKISKYIYQKKANSHPNAIKLLLTLYHNLERIVANDDLSEEERKEILLEDVKRFERLKKDISQSAVTTSFGEPPQEETSSVAVPEVDSEDGAQVLLKLKALVLGIDWEITDHELTELRKEVVRLEDYFVDSRPKLILLQGIGTLGAYIKLKKSNAHADAFKVLHLFYESLEKITTTPMSIEEEKAVLFPAVERFNAFKALLGPTISPEAISRRDDELESDVGSVDDSMVAPALADVDAEEEKGFQAEEEAMALGLEDPDNISSHVDTFFQPMGGPSEQAPAAMDTPADAGEIAAEAEAGTDDDMVMVSRETALEGVDVEADDEDEEVTATLADEALEPAVAEELSEPAPAAEEIEDLAAATGEDHDLVRATDEAIEDFFPEEGTLPQLGDEPEEVDKEAALQGVAVETEADDDSGEVDLPMDGDELAPALADKDEESIYSAALMDEGSGMYDVSPELAAKLDGFFTEEESPLEAGAETERASGAGPEEPDSEIELEDTLEAPEDFEQPEEVSMPASDEPDELTEPLTPAIEPEEEEEEEEEERVAADEDIALAEDFFPPPDDIGEEQDLLLGVEGEEVPVAELEPAVDEPEDQLEVAEAAETGEEDQMRQSGPAIKLTPPQVVSAEAVSSAEKEDEPIADMADEPTPVIEVEEETEFVEEAEPAEEIGLAAEDMPAAFTPEFTPDVLRAAISEDETDAEEEVVFQLAEEAEDEAAPPETSGDELEVAELDMTAETADDQLSDLQACIDSLEVELDSRVTTALLTEINKLRQNWYDRPLEKIFLQLLSTVAQHIDTYKYESSSEAFGLLRMISQAMVDLEEEDSARNHELLLTQTLSVLDWQQGMLARQAVKKGDELTFVDPVRVDESSKEQPSTRDARLDFEEQLLQQIEGVYSEEDGDKTDDAPTFEFAETAEEEPAPGQQATQTYEQEDQQTVAPAGTGDRDDRESVDIREEIAALRTILQNEIAELRRELREK